MNGAPAPTERENGPLGRCPGCGSGQFAAVTNGIDTNYRCETCWRCWDVSFGRANRVDPLSCPTCRAVGHCQGTPVGGAGGVSAADSFPRSDPSPGLTGPPV